LKHLGFNLKMALAQSFTVFNPLFSGTSILSPIPTEIISLEIHSGTQLIHG